MASILLSGISGNSPGYKSITGHTAGEKDYQSGMVSMDRGHGNNVHLPVTGRTKNGNPRQSVIAHVPAGRNPVLCKTNRDFVHGTLYAENDADSPFLEEPDGLHSHSAGEHVSNPA